MTVDTPPVETPTTTVLAKPWWQSRTVAINAVGLLALVIGIIVENAQLVNLPPQALAWLGMVLAIANGLLRFASRQPLAAGAGRTAIVPAPRVSPEPPRPSPPASPEAPHG